MENTKLNPFEDFKKHKDYLVCIDSDGCAMDTMDIKHIKCFGPCMVEEWELGEWSEEILKDWNHVNLYSMTRGINRFKALAVVLARINERYKEIPGVEVFVRWTEESDELSNAALYKEVRQGEGGCLSKALHWSEEVNRGIEALPESLKVPFAGVAEGLAYVHTYADVAIVSSANADAVEAEWGMHGLLEHVDIMLAQNAGSKAYCIERLLEFGYDRDHVMMTGDAPGDLDAADKNGVFFYPILVSHEKESWDGIKMAVERLTGSGFDRKYQEQLIEAFKQNLMSE